MRDLVWALAIVIAWSYVIFMAGYLTGRTEYRRELEEKGH